MFDRFAALAACYYGGRINALSAELNPICPLLALLAHHILHISGLRVKRNGISGACGA